MKAIILFALVVITFLANTQAQQCPNQPSIPQCRGRRNEGVGGEDCTAGLRYFFNVNSGTCMEMHFRGCGGNQNRFCTVRDCVRLCERRGESCPNQPRIPACRGTRDEGHGGTDCSTGTRFFFDVNSGSCSEMHYRGCGGNQNRFCSLRDCDRACVRRD